MELLDLKNFQKAYPNLIKKIDDVIGKPISKQYPLTTKIPIRMQDAAFADSYLETNNKQKNAIGYEKALKIIKVIKLYPNIDNWMKILYPPAKKPKRQKIITSKLKEEFIIFVRKNDKGNYYCVDKNNKLFKIGDEQIWKQMTAYDHKKVIRVRIFESGERKYRVIKQKEK